MPAVRETDANESPPKLEVVEVRPGVFLKLNAADKKAYADAEAAASANRSAWERATIGEAIDDAVEDLTAEAVPAAQEKAAPKRKTTRK